MTTKKTEERMTETEALDIGTACCPIISNPSEAEGGPRAHFEAEGTL